MKRSSKFKCWGICVLITAVVLIALGIAFPFIISAGEISGAKEGAVLQQSTEDKWRGIPGPLDIKIVRNTYLYECTNKDAVTYFIFVLQMSLGDLQW